jgi:hypothetical protein
MNVRGFKVYVAHAFGPQVINAILSRQKQELSMFFLVSGPAGSGKSYFALRLAEWLDPEFDPQVQIVFDRNAFLNLISDSTPLKKGQVLVVDESQFVANARSWYSNLQKDLMAQLEAIRFKNFIIIIVALHPTLLDSVIREHLISFQFSIEKRGTAICYEQHQHRFIKQHYPTRIGKMILNIPSYEKCRSATCLNCAHSGLAKGKWQIRKKWIEMGFEACTIMRARYERRKRFLVEKMGNKALKNKPTEKPKKPKITDAELVEILKNNLDKIERKKDGQLDPLSIRTVLTNLTGVQVIRSRGYELRQQYQEKYGNMVA